MSDKSNSTEGRHLFLATLGALAVVYVALRWGVPWISVLVGFSQTPAPVPGFAIAMYMACATVSALVYVSSENERWNQFLTPVVAVFMIPDGGPGKRQILLLSILPILFGWVAWTQVMPRRGTPSVIRVQHPALPGQYAAMVNPYAEATGEEREALEREGLVLYQKNCRPCHGTHADGRGPLARGQRLQPIDFTNLGAIATVVESHPFWRITTGSLGLPSIATPWNSAMPPWGDELGEDEIWKIIMAEYRLSGTEPREPEELGG